MPQASAAETCVQAKRQCYASACAAAGGWLCDSRLYPCSALLCCACLSWFTHLAAVAALGHCAQLDEAIIRPDQQPLAVLAEAAAVHGQPEAGDLLGLVWVHKVACEVDQLQQQANRRQSRCCVSVTGKSGGGSGVCDDMH